MRPVYLDHQSATAVAPKVLEAMQPFFRDFFGNPSSLHRHGLAARDALEKARQQTARLIGASDPEEIIFASGGAEAINLAVKGAALAGQKRGRHLVASGIEHPNILESIEFLKTLGFSATRLPVDGQGRLDPSAVEQAITPETILIATHHANHDLGVIQPLDAIGRIAARRQIPLFIDATASAGWLPINVETFACSFLALAPDRFYGPKGAGVLYRNRRARLTPLLHGGAQEGGRRAGTENIPAIVGAGAAAELAAAEMPSRMAKLSALQKRLWDGLRRTVPYLCLHGPPPGPERLPGHLNVSVEFLESEALALALDMQGIAVGSGPSCVNKALKIPPVLAAIGVPAALAGSNVLLTLGVENTEGEIDEAIETFAAVVRKLRDLSPQWDEFTRGQIRSVLSAQCQPAPAVS